MPKSSTSFISLVMGCLQDNSPRYSLKLIISLSIVSFVISSVEVADKKDCAVHPVQCVFAE